MALVQHQSSGVLAAKVAMRLAVLPPDRPACVLDCFAGKHDIWDIAQEIAPQPIEVLHNDADRSYRTHLAATAVDALRSLGLDRFDLIDLDSWGPPFEEIRVASERQYGGVVAYTAILPANPPHGTPMKEASTPREWRKFTLDGHVPVADRWVDFLDRSGWQRTHIVQTWGRSGVHLYGVCGGYDQFDIDRHERFYRAALQSRRLAQVFAR